MLETSAILRDHDILRANHKRCICIVKCTTLKFPHSSPKLSRTSFWHFLLNPFGSSRHIFAASTFAGLSSLGELSMLMTDNKIVSGLCTGVHLSAADSYPYLSSSGGCRIDMQTSPFGYTAQLSQLWSFEAKLLSPFG